MTEVREIYVGADYEEHGEGRYMLDEVNVGDVIILHDTEEKVDYKMVVESDSEYHKCESCPFGYDNELDAYRCPYRDCHYMNVTFKLVDKKCIGINMNKYIKIMDIAKKICSPDICLYHASDRSCEESADICLLKIIAM